MQEQLRSSLQYLEDVTTLLQRVRGAHPTKGLFEAADFQWWWRNPRSTDTLGQLFWFDESGRPEAAIIATDWQSVVALDPIVMPDATPEWVTHVTQRGIAHAAELGLDKIVLEVSRDDYITRDALENDGFSIKEEGLVETWLAADARPEVSPLPHGYQLLTRLETMHRPHHMINPKRNHADVEPRLRQTSLYRPDLDLVVHDADGEVAAYGLFWYDPTTETGLVEPMRTEDAHQRRGLARHLLTAGIDLVAKAGAQRIKICFEPDNAASSHLYLSVGFEPVKQTDIYTRGTAQQP